MNPNKACVSMHEARFFAALNHDKWQTTVELSERLGISGGAARGYALRFTQLGITEVRKIYPGYRYRLSANVGQDGASYLKRLHEAVAALGLPAVAKSE